MNIEGIRNEFKRAECSGEVFKAPLTSPERFYLPKAVYERLKKIYIESGLKKISENFLLQKLSGKNILFIQSGIGETFMLANYLRARFKKLPYDNIIAIREGAAQAFQLYFPEYEVRRYRGRILRNIEKTFQSLHGKEILFYLGQDFWRNFAKKNDHIIPAVSAFLRIDMPELKAPGLLAGHVQTAQILMAENGLKPGNFVFLNMSANSSLKLPMEDVRSLVDGLKAAGHKVFVNSQENGLDLGATLAVADAATAIVCLRSGFSELLATLKKPVHIIYTTGTIRDFYGHFSLSRYPVVGQQSHEWIYQGAETINQIVRYF